MLGSRPMLAELRRLKYNGTSVLTVLICVGKRYHIDSQRYPNNMSGWSTEGWFVRKAPPLVLSALNDRTASCRLSLLYLDNNRELSQLTESEI